MSVPLRYGRPVTEWSTPPAAEGKPSAFRHGKADRLQHSSSSSGSAAAVGASKGVHRTTISETLSSHIPPSSSSSSSSTTHAQDLASAIQGLTLVPSTTRTTSWAPLTAVPTPAVKHPPPSYAVMDPGALPPPSVSSEGLIQRCTNVPVDGSNKVRLERSSEGADERFLATSSRGEVLQPLSHSSLKHSLKQVSHPLQQASISTSDPAALQPWAPSKLHRSLSEQQLYAPLPESTPSHPHPLTAHTPSTPLDYATTRLKTTLPSHSSKAATPTARVQPLVDAQRGDGRSHTVRSSSLTTVGFPDSKSSVEVLPLGGYGGSELEKMKLLSLSSPVVAEGGLVVSHDYHMTPSEYLGSAEKWKALIETKDRIMVQKNNLIERQKQTIARLQAEVREGEGRLAGALSVRAQEDGGTALTAHIKELELQTSSLQGELAEARRTGSSQSQLLSKKLDAAVYELDRLQVQFTESQRQADTLTSDLRRELEQREERISEVEEELTSAQHKQEELSQHITKLSSYLGDMPTMEEHQALIQQVEGLRVAAEGHSRALGESQAGLEHTLAALHSREGQCRVAEQRLEEVQQRLASSQSELLASDERVAVLTAESGRLTAECARLEKLLREAEEGGRAELQAMRERHKHKFLEATASLRTQHKSQAKRVRLLETQLLKNSDAMSALNSELQLSQGTISDLKGSIRELVQQNQGLVEQNITLKETAAEASKVASSVSEARTAAIQQVTSELGRCVEEFDSLVALSSSIVEGQDPSASLVLGVKGRHSSSGEVRGHHGGGGGVKGQDGEWEERLAQVRRLQGEVERLREAISDQFAAQVATACNVQ